MRKTLLFIFSILASLLLASSTALAFLEYDQNIVITGKEYTYEGHLYRLNNDSTYHLGSTTSVGSFTDVKTAMTKGYIDCSWAGHYSKMSGDILHPDIIYENPGTDTITLSSTWLDGPKKGEEYIANKKLEIRACPFVDSVALSGEQRTNRKQIITVRIAQNPKYPIENVKIEIPGAICLEPEITTSNEFITCNMVFLTKNKETQEFSYLVSASDSRGQLCHSSSSFTVIGDRPPAALVDMKYMYYRQQTEDGMTAIVSASQTGKITDDPVVYEWWVTDEQGNSYTGLDASMGLNMAQTFKLKKLGKYIMHLKVTDVWDNGIEGITSKEDHLSAEYQRAFVVDNMAPLISLGSGAMKPSKLNLVLLNYKGDPSLLEEELRSNSIIPNIVLETSPSYGTSESLEHIGEIYNEDVWADLNEDYFWDSAVFCDEEYLYRLQYGEPASALRYRLDNLSASPDIIAVSDPEFFASQFTNEFQMTNANGDFPIYDSMGNVHYYYSADWDGNVYLKDINGEIIDSSFLNDSWIYWRNAAGLEFDDGSIAIIFGADHYVDYWGNWNMWDNMEIVYFNAGTSPCLSSLYNLYDQEYGFKYKDTVVLSYSFDYYSLIEVFKFSPSYSSVIASLKESYFDDSYDLNMLIDCDVDEIDIDKIISICTNTEPSSTSSFDFNISYYDAESDPLLKAYYSYAGKTIELNSLSFSVDPVPGFNEIKIWAYDDCGNSEYNKKSNVIKVKIGNESMEIEDPPVSGGPRFRLHRVY